ncbi:MAG: 5-deoxy-glucuronate isomerase [Leifsonia sp.]
MPHTNERFHARGSLAEMEWESVVSDQMDGWSHAGLRVAELTRGERLNLPSGVLERIIVPLAGSFQVTWFDEGGGTGSTSLEGRDSVFSGPSDVLYLGVGAACSLSGVGRVAVAEAAATTRHPIRYIPKSEVEIELRGAGRSSRQVHNFGTPDSLQAGKLIVCEVITPAENWSSYPAHKHDENRPGLESRLEEIYYFEAAIAKGLEAPSDADPFGLFMTSSSPAGDIDTHATVRTGDIALVPFGYHGPAVAAPGYDLYYLNVMAGPDAERAWRITDDPAQGWVRETWGSQATDPRLPYLGTPRTDEGEAHG